MLTHFTNIPLKKSNICTNLPYKKVEDINKFEFEKLLSLATQESYFMCNDTLYKQKDGLTMGLPLEPTMANVLISFYELKWLEQCLSDFKPVSLQKIC